MVKDCRQSLPEVGRTAATAERLKEPFILRQSSEAGRLDGRSLPFPRREPGDQFLHFIIVVRPERKTRLTSQQVLNLISERVLPRKLTAHPSSAETVSNYGRKPAHVSDRMRLDIRAEF